MKSAQLKSIAIIVLLFGGLAWYFTGGIALPDFDFSGIKEKFSSNKTTAKTTTNKTKSNRKSSNSKYNTGQVIDSYKGVKVYYNGNVTNVSGRNLTSDGYNLGLKYQCVEFAKRFYYEAYKHKMPDSYGHAKDFFDSSLRDGQLNRARDMYQFRNGSREKPKVDDLVIIGPSSFNSFGHLFIVTNVTNDAVEFVQQNPGSRNPSRGRFPLVKSNGTYTINADDVVGWLRMG